MTNHIYSRANILASQQRPHMFINELQLNVDYLKEQTAELKQDEVREIKDAIDFAKQLLTGIEYYRSISGTMPSRLRFNSRLDSLENEILHLSELLTAHGKAA